MTPSYPCLKCGRATTGFLCQDCHDTFINPFRQRRALLEVEEYVTEWLDFYEYRDSL